MRITVAAEPMVLRPFLEIVMGKQLFGFVTFQRLLQLPSNWRARRRLPGIRIGDIYLDCNRHPVVCTESILDRSSIFGPWDFDLSGVSLLDGTSPRSCSARHCAPRKVSMDFAILWVAVYQQLPAALDNINQIVAESPEIRRVWS